MVGWHFSAPTPDDFGQQDLCSFEPWLRRQSLMAEALGTSGLFQTPSPGASHAGSLIQAAHFLSPPSATECNVHHDGRTYCACLSGYQWNASVCSRHRLCQSPHSRGPCGCLVLSPAEAGYCQLLPPGEEVGNLERSQAQWLQAHFSQRWEKRQLPWQIRALSLGPE